MCLLQAAVARATPPVLRAPARNDRPRHGRGKGGADTIKTCRPRAKVVGPKGEIVLKLGHCYCFLKDKGKMLMAKNAELHLANAALCKPEMMQEEPEQNDVRDAQRASKR